MVLVKRSSEKYFAFCYGVLTVTFDDVFYYFSVPVLALSGGIMLFFHPSVLPNLIHGCKAGAMKELKVQAKECDAG